MEKIRSPWSVPVAVDDIPETGLHLEIDAPEPVRAELAKLAGLRELARLSAVFDLTRRGAGVRVTGSVSARVGQTCVVTLEPIESDIEESVDVLFAPRSVAPASAKPETVAVHTSDDEPPEPLFGGKLDLGAIATEFLLLGIDPYPRKPGAEFAPVAQHGGRWQCETLCGPGSAEKAPRRRLAGSGGCGDGANGEPACLRLPSGYGRGHSPTSRTASLPPPLTPRAIHAG